MTLGSLENMVQSWTQRGKSIFPETPEEKQLLSGLPNGSDFNGGKVGSHGGDKYVYYGSLDAAKAGLNNLKSEN